MQQIITIPIQCAREHILSVFTEKALREIGVSETEMISEISEWIRMEIVTRIGSRTYLELDEKPMFDRIRQTLPTFKPESRIQDPDSEASLHFLEVILDPVFEDLGHLLGPLKIDRHRDYDVKFLTQRRDIIVITELEDARIAAFEQAVADGLIPDLKGKYHKGE